MKKRTLKITMLLITILTIFGITYGNVKNKNSGAIVEDYTVDTGADYIEYDDDYYVNRVNPVDESKTIGINRAKEIALRKVPGANRTHIGEFHLDYEYGRPVYEGSIYYNRWEYEFDIDAMTGKILKWEKDRD